MKLPAEVFAHHSAVVGKTGSGKTSTAKLMVEHVAAGSRVCVLDPIKSDWWGLISSADGKQPGLPFHILGGPHGHVPLHETSGKAIGELVATGALQLSIIDMADFRPGGLQKFFSDFAAALIRNMRGVVYLVIEEAHEFAPKERAGLGDENLSIHWAKKLATAGRSKGIRLILVTQRTQSLHNALLGSCETVIAHRLTLPADQKPVADWLKSNMDKVTAEKVIGSMASLKTGAGWVCSGEAKIGEQMQLPRIKTYDNSATPTDDADSIEVKSAPVDQEKLRAIIGDAVKEAEANDPKALRAEIARLKRELSAQPSAGASEYQLATARTEGFRQGQRAGYQEGCRDGWAMACDEASKWPDAMRKAIPDWGPIEQTPMPSAPVVNGSSAPHPHAASSGPGIKLSRVETRILTALAQYPDGRTKTQVAILTGYASTGGGFNNGLSSLRSAGRIEGSELLRITERGFADLGHYEPLPHGAALLEHWRRQLSKAERSCLDALTGHYPRAMAKERLAELAGYEASGGGFNNALSRLRTLELIEGRGEIRASDHLFG